MIRRSALDLFCLRPGPDLLAALSRGHRVAQNLVEILLQALNGPATLLTLEFRTRADRGLSPISPPCPLLDVADQRLGRHMGTGRRHAEVVRIASRTPLRGSSYSAWNKRRQFEPGIVIGLEGHIFVAEWTLCGMVHCLRS